MKPLLLIAVFILMGSPLAKACNEDEIFKASIDRECEQAYFRCVDWSEIPDEKD